jgi:hypothetical protein
MFIGHFAVAYILIVLAPGVPPAIPLIGVSFPDLLWPVLVLTGVEKATVDPATPRQNAITFVRYPFSHSLVTGTLIAVIPGIIIGLFFGPLAGIIFVAASASHWLLDSVVHLKDLPVLGFGNDRTIGLGLWNRGGLAFFVELAFYVAITLIVVPAAFVVPLLAIGIVFHLINANSFFGFTKKNPFSSPKAYAIITLIGFSAFILLANTIFGRMG